MYQTLSRYLAQYKKLDLPSVGSFHLQLKNAQNDVAGRSLYAPGWMPVFSSAMHQTETAIPDPAESAQLYDFLANHLGLSRDDVVLDFDEFCKSILQQLLQGETIQWEGLGLLVLKDNDILFEPDAADHWLPTPVAAKKVLRQNASHSVLVGEKETTSDEMRQRLQEVERRPSGNKIAWIVLCAVVAAAAWYFFRNGCNAAAVGNRQQIETMPASDSYRLQ